MASGSVIKLQGEQEYKNALKEITTGLKLMSSELKLATSEFTSGDKTLKQTKTSYDSMNKSLDTQRNAISKMKDELKQAEKEYGSNNVKVQEFKTKLNQAEIQLKEMEDATDKSNKELVEMRKGFDNAGDGAIKFGDVLKANVIGDFIVDGLKKVGSAVVDMGKQAIAGFGEFEQLEGGVKKLFGSDMTTVIKNANDAFKTAGMSTNEYMETVTSFSASLIGSLKGNTKEAVNYADMAIRDMSDNANTFGTDMASIQNAYQGFAKGNFGMLDNLKLGYGGTKTEMQRLLKEAEKMPEAMGKKFDMSNYADIVEAIHIVQQNMKITGTTFNEASGTIEGSISSMKSAWENWVSGLANENADLSQLTSNLGTAITDVVENLKPVISQVLGSIGEVISIVLQETLPQGVFDTLKNSFQWIIDNKDLLIAGITGIAVALGTLNVVNMITGIVNAFKAWKLANEGVTIAQMLLNTVMSLNPIGLIIAGVTGLVAGLIALWNTNEGFRNSCIAVWEKIKEVFTAVWGVITEFFTKKVPEIVNNVIEFFKKIPQWFNELPEKLGYALGYAIGKIIKWGTDSWNYLKENVPKWISNIGTFFSELPGKVWTWLLNTIQKVKTWASDMAQKGKKGAIDLFNNVINTIKELPSKMLNIGKNIVEGIWNGIVNAKNWIVDKVKGFAKGILNGIKDALGIHSPSKVFEEEVGKNMALGLGQGFSNSMGSIAKDMQRSIPTEFDTNATINGIGSNASSSSNTYANMVNAFKEALSQMKIELDDEVAGKFVETTVTNLIYT